MRKKTKVEKILDLVFWGIIAILTIVELYNSGLNELDISELKSINFQDIEAKQYVTFVLSLFFVTAVCVLFSMFKVFYLVVAYFGLKIAIKKHSKERLEKIDFKNDNYYREILPKYSPAVLSYVDDFKIGKEDIVATLLTLEMKGKVKIEDNNIVVLDSQSDNLDKNETYILDKVKKNVLVNINMIEYERVVKDDAFNSGLIQEKETMKKNIKGRIIKNIIIYIFIILAFNIVPVAFANVNNEMLLILVFMFLIIIFALLVFIPFVTVSYISSYKLLNTVEPYIRSDEGKVINQKLEGLRKYLTDFSQIEEKTKEQLVLWNEYFIYSVILGINTKVVDEIYEKIK